METFPHNNGDTVSQNGANVLFASKPVLLFSMLFLQQVTGFHEDISRNRDTPDYHLVWATYSGNALGRALPYTLATSSFHWILALLIRAQP